MKAARASLNKVKCFMNQIKERPNKEKTSYILFGDEAMNKEIRKKLSEEPLVCGSFDLKESPISTWEASSTVLD